MAAQPRDPNKKDTQPGKKKSETVQLTAEELRKIAGGATTQPPPPGRGGHDFSTLPKK
jgi:hypothetical protein